MSPGGGRPRIRSPSPVPMPALPSFPRSSSPPPPPPGPPLERVVLEHSDETRIQRPRRPRAPECKSVKIMYTVAGPSPVPMPPLPSFLLSSLPPPPFPRPPLERVVLENSDETMSRLFPTRRERLRNTYVLWDMSDYPIPENFDPLSIGKQIQSAITKEGCRGELQIWLYGAENTWSPELIDQLEQLHFFVYPFKGVKRARLNLILACFLAFVLMMTAPTNLLMLSSNKEEIEQEPKFARVRKILRDKGFCVVSAQPDALINPDAPRCDSLA